MTSIKKESVAMPAPSSSSSSSSSPSPSSSSSSCSSASSASTSTSTSLFDASDARNGNNKRPLRSLDKKRPKKVRSCSPSAFLEAEFLQEATNVVNQSKATPKHPMKEKADAMLKAVSAMYYRPKSIDAVGFGDRWSSEEYEQFKFPTLDLLLTPLRQAHVLDSWTPKEIALFEAGMCSLGKDFHAIQQLIKTKKTNDVIDFYYAWKKSSHYQIWKELGKPSRKFHSGKPEQWDMINEKMASTI